MRPASRTIARETAGRRAHASRSPASRSLLERLRLELRLDVHHPRTSFDEAAATRSCTADAIAGQAAQARLDAGGPRGDRVTFFGAAAGVAAWAAPAASSSMIEDRGDLGLDDAAEGRPRTLDRRKANDRQPRPRPALFTVFRANVAAAVSSTSNREQCLTHGRRICSDVFDTLQIYLGSLYVNDFNLFGRTWQVVVQAEAEFRDEVEDVKRLKVRNASGEMVPLGALADVREINGPLVLTRYNMYPAAADQRQRRPRASARARRSRSWKQLADAGAAASRWPFEWTEISLPAS